MSGNAKSVESGSLSVIKSITQRVITYCPWAYHTTDPTSHRMSLFCARTIMLSLTMAVSQSNQQLY